MLTIQTTKKLILAGAAAILMSNTAIAAEMTLKLGHLANEQNAWHKAAVKFGEELSTLSLGRPVLEAFARDCHIDSTKLHAVNQVDFLAKRFIREDLNFNTPVGKG